MLRRNYRWFIALSCSIVVLLLTIGTSSAEDQNAAYFHGSVKDRNGYPLKGAEVSFRENNGTASYTNITNESGFFQLNEVQVGEYEIYGKYGGKEYFNRIINITINTSEIDDIILPVSSNGTEDDDTGGGGGEDGEKACDRGSGGTFNIITIIIISTIILIIISTLLYSRIRRSQVLKHETRQRIRDHVMENPGDHFSAIRDKLKLSTGVLNYHLERLEKERFVSSRSEGKYKCFYPPNWQEPPGIRLTPVQESILEQVRKGKGISQSEITRLIGRNRKVVNYNVHQLRELGLVDIEREGRETKCYFVKNA